MTAMRRNSIILAIVAFSITLDQITKSMAVNTLKFAPPSIYLGDFFRLQYAENSGAMLGFGSDLPDWIRFWLLTVFVGLLLVALVSYLLFSKDMTLMHTLGLSSIAGGGISNFVDRLLNDGHVVDFMNMGIGSLRTGIFNFADVVIMIGMGIILVFGGWKTAKATDEEEEVGGEESDAASEDRSPEAAS